MTSLQGGVPFLAISLATKEHEEYVLEAVYGKIALVHRVVYVPLDQAPDQKVYANQAVAKFGKQSLKFDRWRFVDGTSFGDMHWSWDRAGRQVNYDVCPAGFTGLGTQGDLPRITDYRAIKYPKTELAPEAVMQVPGSDIPNCHLHFAIQTSSTTTDTAHGAVNRFEMRLEDPSVFYPEVTKMIAAQKAKASDAQKALEKRSGPPM